MSDCVTENKIKLTLGASSKVTIRFREALILFSCITIILLKYVKS